MNRWLLFILTLIFSAALVSALSGRVMVLGLHFENGNISLINSTIKYGYYPDRRYQPEEGYRLEIVGKDDTALESFRFKVPNRIFVDGTDEEGKISGGLIELEKVDFALTIPYSEDMKRIRIYSTDESEIGDIEIDNEKEGITKYLIIIVIVAVLISIIIFGIKFTRRKVR